MRRWPIVGSLLLFPIVLGAQDFSRIFTSVERVAVFGRWGGFLPRSRELLVRNSSSGQTGLYGYGVEMSYRVPEEEGASATAHFEVGLGYSQYGGFGARTADMDLRGAIRELPSIAFYAWHDGSGGVATPYVGLITGLIKLANTVAYKTDGSQFLVNAEAFTMGAAGGLQFDPGTVPAFFVELGYRLRHFASVEYRETGGATDVPDTWPRKMNFSGWSVDFGVQISIKGKSR
jgi:hypothetical protein